MTRQQERFLTAWNEWKVADARLRNRDPAPLRKIREENANLAVRIQDAEEHLFSLLKSDGILIEHHADRERAELLRLKSLEFLKTLKVDPELWQSLASS